ncbi:MAG: hypothetical protein R3A50_17705 [Saprospiraceae bacterium]
MAYKILVFSAFLLFAGTIIISSCRHPKEMDMMEKEMEEEMEMEEDTCTIPQLSYIGQYTINEYCSASNWSSYLISISSGGTDSTIVISNFWDAFLNNIIAEIECDSVFIPRQEPDGDQYFVEGEGVFLPGLVKDTLKLSYKVTDENDPGNILSDSCTESVFIKN